MRESFQAQLLEWAMERTDWSNKTIEQLMIRKGGYKEPLILLKVDPIWLKELGCTRYGHSTVKAAVAKLKRTKVDRPPPFDPPYTVVSEQDQNYSDCVSLHASYA